jgi:hypothetical protein
VNIIVPVHKQLNLRAKHQVATSHSIWYKSDIVNPNPIRTQLAIMGKMKKAGINEKAVDARAAKEMAKSSKQEKESKQKEDADWAAAGEGTRACHTFHALLVTLPFAGRQRLTAAPTTHDPCSMNRVAGKLTKAQQDKERKAAAAAESARKKAEAKALAAAEEAEMSKIGKKTAKPKVDAVATRSCGNEMLLQGPQRWHS